VGESIANFSILVGAVIAAVLGLSRAVDVALEYALGFAFGLLIFQALFMRGMAGGSYLRALRTSFIPELLSMNCLMAGMVPVMIIAMNRVEGAHEPTHPAFWFVMSMALLVGAIAAYPMNWWLVSNHLKHGMTTVRPQAAGAPAHDATMAHGGAMPSMAGVSAGHAMPDMGHSVSPAQVAVMTALSIVALAVGLGVAAAFGGSH